MSARSRRGRPKDLKRRTGVRAERATIRVYCEGSTTEPEYIDALKRLPDVASSTSIAIGIVRAGGQPMLLVEAACKDKRRNDLDIDHYWCVVDVESPQPHPHLNGARQMARDNGISLAISNPCFELWLILHHQDQTAHLATSKAVQLRHGLDGSESKHLDGAFYMERRGDASQRAQRLRSKHERDQTTFPHDNPSSDFDRFIADVEERATAHGLSSPSGGAHRR